MNNDPAPPGLAEAAAADPAARPMLADWLEEQGDPRARRLRDRGPQDAHWLDAHACPRCGRGIRAPGAPRGPARCGPPCAWAGAAGDLLPPLVQPEQYTRPAPTGGARGDET